MSCLELQRGQVLYRKKEIKNTVKRKYGRSYKNNTINGESLQ